MRRIVSGIRNLEEAWYFINAGVDGLGFILEPKSKKYINPESAREIILQLPPLITTIAVFANTPRYVIQELTTFCRLDWFLFSGSESPKECEDYFQPIIKYLTNYDLHKEYKEVNNFLFDSDTTTPFDLNGWETSQTIFHSTDSTKNEIKAFALYLDLSSIEFEI